MWGENWFQLSLCWMNCLHEFSFPSVQSAWGGPGTAEMGIWCWFGECFFMRFEEIINLSEYFCQEEEEGDYSECMLTWTSRLWHRFWFRMRNLVLSRSGARDVGRQLSSLICPHRGWFVLPFSFPNRRCVGENTWDATGCASSQVCMVPLSGSNKGTPSAPHWSLGSHWWMTFGDSGGRGEWSRQSLDRKVHMHTGKFEAHAQAQMHSLEGKK